MSIFLTVYGVHYKGLVQATNMIRCVQKVEVKKNHFDAYAHGNFEIYTSIVPVYEPNRPSIMASGRVSSRPDSCVLGAFPFSPQHWEDYFTTLLPIPKPDG